MAPGVLHLLLSGIVLFGDTFLSNDMGILNSIFKGIFKGKVDQLKKSLKDDPEINQLSKKIKKQLKEIKHDTDDILIRYAIAELIVTGQPLSDEDKKIYLENKTFIDGKVELTREYKFQREEMTKFLYDNFINNYFPFEMFKLAVDEVSESDIEAVMEDKYSAGSMFTGIEFLDLINNKTSELLRMMEYENEGGFETNEVIQSAREEIAKLKEEYLKKKLS